MKKFLLIFIILLFLIFFSCRDKEFQYIVIDKIIENPEILFDNINNKDFVTEEFILKFRDKEKIKSIVELMKDLYGFEYNVYTDEFCYCYDSTGRGNSPDTFYNMIILTPNYTINGTNNKMEKYKYKRYIITFYFININDKWYLNDIKL